MLNSGISIEMGNVILRLSKEAHLTQRITRMALAKTYCYELY